MHIHEPVKHRTSPLSQSVQYRWVYKCNYSRYLNIYIQHKKHLYMVLKWNNIINHIHWGLCLKIIVEDIQVVTYIHLARMCVLCHHYVSVSKEIIERLQHCILFLTLKDISFDKMKLGVSRKYICLMLTITFDWTGINKLQANGFPYTIVCGIYI